MEVLPEVFKAGAGVIRFCGTFIGSILFTVVAIATFLLTRSVNL